MRDSLKELGLALRIEETKDSLKDLEAQTQSPDFWNSAEKSSKTLQIIKQAQDKRGVQPEQQLQEHIHKHSFDIKSKKVFSFVAGLGIVCALSLWGNITQWQSNRQYADDALKFRAIRAWGGCNSNDVLWLNKVFDIQRDEKAIEWVRKQTDGYDASLKAVSDSLMQESIKTKADMQDRK